MRSVSLACLILVSAACSGDSAVNAPGTARLHAGQSRSANGPPATAPGAAQRPVDGSGTPGQLALWLGNATLGDAPIRMDANGNLILKPGTSLFVPSADGTKCAEIRGASLWLHKSGCPVTW